MFGLRLRLCMGCEIQKASLVSGNYPSELNLLGSNTGMKVSEWKAKMGVVGEAVDITKIEIGHFSPNPSNPGWGWE